MWARLRRRCYPSPHSQLASGHGGFSLVTMTLDAGGISGHREVGCKESRHCHVWDWNAGPRRWGPCMEAGCPLESRVEERRTAARAGGMLDRWHAGEVALGVLRDWSQGP